MNERHKRLLLTTLFRILYFSIFNIPLITFFCYQFIGSGVAEIKIFDKVHLLEYSLWDILGMKEKAFIYLFIAIGVGISIGMMVYLMKKRDSRKEFDYRLNRVRESKSHSQKITKEFDDDMKDLLK